jgi:hypothetical protein
MKLLALYACGGTGEGFKVHMKLLEQQKIGGWERCLMLSPPLTVCFGVLAAALLFQAEGSEGAFPLHHLLESRLAHLDVAPTVRVSHHDVAVTQQQQVLLGCRLKGLCVDLADTHDTIDHALHVSRALASALEQRPVAVIPSHQEAVLARDAGQGSDTWVDELEVLSSLKAHNAPTRIFAPVESLELVGRPLMQGHRWKQCQTVLIGPQALASLERLWRSRRR